MSNYSIRPEDILSDNENHTNINGILVRKGSIAAFLKNIEIIENPESLEQHKADALKTMENLAPALVAAGIHKYTTFKNPTVQAILDKAA